MHPLDVQRTTFVTPLGAVFMLFTGALILGLPRKYALFPVVLCICCMTLGTNVVIGGFNFTILRLMLLLGFLRLAIRGEFRRLTLNGIDKALIWFVISSIVAHTLLWESYAAFKYKLGFAYSELGFYFLFRTLLKDREDFARVCKMLIALLVPLALVMVRERLTGANYFAALGGVPEFSSVRSGIVRAQGPFATSITAGTFGATIIPYLLVVWQGGSNSRILTVLGGFSALTIIFACGSSGPVLSALAALGCMCLWSMRTRLRVLFWAIVGVLATLQLVMQAPIWFLIARMSVLGSSDAFHRAYLIDRAIANFSDWWLVGTRNSAAWGSKYFQLYDITNVYIAHGVDGGLITMVLFVVVIVRCFRALSRAIVTIEKNKIPGGPIVEWAFWAALTSHVITFMSVTYMDQNSVNWTLLLAMISGVIGATQKYAPKKSQVFCWTPEFDSVPLAGRVLPPDHSVVRG